MNLAAREDFCNSIPVAFPNGTDFQSKSEAPATFKSDVILGKIKQLSLLSTGNDHV